MSRAPALLALLLVLGAALRAEAACAAGELCLRQRGMTGRQAEASGACQPARLPRRGGEWWQPRRAAASGGGACLRADTLCRYTPLAFRHSTMLAARRGAVTFAAGGSRRQTSAASPSPPPAASPSMVARVAPAPTTRVQVRSTTRLVHSARPAPRAPSAPWRTCPKPAWLGACRKRCPVCSVTPPWLGMRCCRLPACAPA